MSRKFLIVIPALLVLSACKSPGPTNEDIGMADEPTVDKPFERGLQALEKEDFATAARIFDSLVVSKPGTEYELISIYNSGSAYEGLGNCNKASERYREMVRASAGKFKRLEAEALFRNSIMYDCQGQHAKAVTALLDAKKRGEYLAPSVLMAEIPARLAAAYARLGNPKKALEYFNQASVGLKKIVAQETGRKQADILGSSLYLMGQLNPAQRRAEGDPLAFLRGLSMQQPYLLQAVELHHSPWSQRALNDLNLAYDNIWKFKLEDPQMRNDYYTRALQTVREMRRIRMPKPDPTVDGIFTKLDGVETRIQNELARVAETNPLTVESTKREGLRREGRLVDPTKKTAPPKKRR